MDNQPFGAQQKTLPISVTSTASTSTALPGVAANVLRIINLGPNKAFFSVGTGTQTATLPNATPTNTSTPILSGTDVTFTIPNDAIQNISAICASTETATLYVQVGEGL